MPATPASVLFPEYRRKVLGLLLLHPEHSYHLREIARLTATTPGTLTRELARLAEAGLLERARAGNQVRYAANTRSPIFAELAGILRKTSGLADVLADALAPLADNIQTAFVFGSAASGKAGAGSDIDVLVVGDGFTFGDVVALLHPQQEVLGREINPKVYTREEWRALARGDNRFHRDILSKPKLMLIGGDHEPG
jgi:predicted nucleotidyltransferase